jgi:hypothetical protein
MPTTIAIASPTIGSPVIGVWDKFLAVVSNRDFIVITIFSTLGILMAILFAVYFSPLEDPAALLNQTAKASQVKVAQSRLGLDSASAEKGDADRTDVTSALTPRRPIPNTDVVALADDQPLMATGLDLNGPPKRFPAKEILTNLEIPGF